MPELPEITVYIEALERFVRGKPLDRVRVRSPSLLRTYDPPLSHVHGRTVTGIRRLGKRIVFDFEDADPALFLVLHLMVTGRLRWREPGATVPRKVGLAAFDFPDGTLLLTEAGMKKKASLHLVERVEGLAAHDRGGLEPLGAGIEAFREAITRENRTLKRALTDPRILSGIGNAHSDEILLEAKLSPLKRSHDLSEEETLRLFEATQRSLGAWTEILRAEVGDSFPEKITAFHPDMAAHGKHGEACPQCGSPIQRIKYADNETNYCATCQTGGRLLADRAFSRLLREDWPRSIEELEGLLEDRRRR
jgi:formamidopyrimidine-DNA glycosylase